MTEFFGINLVGLFIIVVLTEIVKKLDSKRTLKNIYVVIPLIFSIGVSYLFIEEFTVKQFIIDCVLYSSISAYAYDILKKVVDKKIEALVEE